MSDLFTDLYRYRQREKKNNFEDWLTECVAAILRSLPKSLFAEFVSRLTGQRSDDIENAYDDISIATQVTIERGATGTQRPDLLISIAAPEKEGKKEPSQPWLLFENKVFHHVDEQELESGEIENQLHRYGTWLSNQPFDRPQLKQTLVFITHGTPAPSDFKVTSSSNPAYSELDTQEKTWSKVAEILDEITADYDSALHFRVLISAYRSFLKEHGMADEYPEYRDYAALASFTETVERFNKLVNEMIGKLDGVAPFAGRVNWASVDAEWGTYEASRYLAKDKRYDGDTYLATGIWFPDRGDGFYSDDVEEQDRKPVTLAPKIYIQLANRTDDALNGLAGKPEGNWYRPRSDFFTFRDVASFPPDPAEAAAAILNWVETEGAKLSALIAS